MSPAPAERKADMEPQFGISGRPQLRGGGEARSESVILDGVVVVGEPAGDAHAVRENRVR